MSEPTAATTGNTNGVPTRNWWGGQWLAAVSADTARHAKEVLQGEALFRRGAVSDLVINAGVARATVSDRNDTATVTCHVAVLSHTMWEQLAAVVAEQLRFTAALLRHQFPAVLHERLRAHDVHMFPTHEDMTFHSDVLGAGVNRHTVALHRAVGVRIDRDPNVLFGLRGRDIEQIVKAVSTQRGDLAAMTDVTETPVSAQIAALTGLVLHPRLVEDPAWLLAKLDEPPPVVAFDALAQAVHRAASVAWRIAAGDGADAADTELLLAELRARRIGTALALADAIGQDVDTVATQLDVLFDAGVVLRTGTPPNVKYRVADR
jgi:uncharacterized Zn finger protein